MAFEADGILCGGCAELACQESAVLVVAVRALYQAFVYAMVEGAVELLFGFLVTPVAEQRLFFLQQVLGFLWMMGIVAVDTGDAVLCVLGTREVAVLGPILMATEAARAYIGGRGVLKSKNLGFVAAAVDVRFAGTVASFATMPLGAFLGIQRRYEMRRVLVRLEKALARHVLMAGLAGIRADVESRIGGPFPRLLCGFLLLALISARAIAARRSGRHRYARQNDHSQNG